jgi:pSer/pThr/pTyr-binding forkhead associated (FHA) protein
MLILLLLLPNGDRKEYNFEANSSIKIGSDPICDVVIPGIDKVHCTLILYYEDNFYYLLFDGEIQRGLSSGVWVNSKRIFLKRRISNQDIVTFSEDSIYPHLILFPDGVQNQ